MIRPPAIRQARIPAIRPRRHSAVTPAPVSMASPRITVGVARSVDRRANPASVRVMKVLRARPMAEGELKGWAPTARTMPISTSRAK